MFYEYIALAALWLIDTRIYQRLTSYHATKKHFSTHARSAAEGSTVGKAMRGIHAHAKDLAVGRLMTMLFQHNIAKANFAVQLLLCFTWWLQIQTSYSPVLVQIFRSIHIRWTPNIHPYACIAIVIGFCLKLTQNTTTKIFKSTMTVEWWPYMLKRIKMTLQTPNYLPHNRTHTCATNAYPRQDHIYDKPKTFMRHISSR